MYERILVTLDGSKNARAALREAIQLAQHLTSELVVVSVATDQTYDLYGAKFGRDIVAHFKAQADTFLKQAVEEVQAAGVAVTSRFQVGLPKVTIAKTLPEEFQTSLTVIGRSGVHGIKRAIMGSTTSYVVKNSVTNVLVVD